MNSIIEQQREFFHSHATKDTTFRIRELDRLAKVWKEYQTEMDKAIYTDFKKSPFETYVTEWSQVWHDIKLAKRNLKKWSRRKKVSTNLINFPASSYIIPEPLGVCLVIGAWNYPYELSLAPVVAALAAGNTVVLKPSEIPSQTSEVIAHMINDNFDPRVLHVIQGGVEETTQLLECKFDKIFFTGSTKVGKIIYKAAAKQLTPVTLELGGKSPAIICEDANLKMAAKRLVWAKFLNAGQTCIAPDYIMVDQKVKKVFLTHVIEEIEQAHYAFDHDNYVQIIDDKNYDRLLQLIDRSKVIYGGNTDASERYIAPTLMDNVAFDDAVMKEEIFGPILPILTYESLEKAISQISNLPRPLSCYMFTSSSKTRNRLLKTLSFGGGAVNDAVMHFSNPNLPFGGVGKSGIGNYHGKAGFDCFTHYKSILDKPTWLELPLKYAPYSQRKFKWIKRLTSWQ
ncbi:MAG: aldehyde dehydrogenase [Flavobacteriaceae bacterium]|nr:aldehyde dehydrogenase [Flavobacteriaceae bacterium]